MMYCGVKFCGGCNPRYDRMRALDDLKERFAGKVRFEYADEDTDYDALLVLGGCTNCCPSVEQYKAGGVIKIRGEFRIEDISTEVEKYM